MDKDDEHAAECNFFLQNQKEKWNSKLKCSQQMFASNKNKKHAGAKS